MDITTLCYIQAASLSRLRSVKNTHAVTVVARALTFGWLEHRKGLYGGSVSGTEWVFCFPYFCSPKYLTSYERVSMEARNKDVSKLSREVSVIVVHI
jgi:hypothetical protein